MASNKAPRFTARGGVIEDYKRGAKRVEVRLYSAKLDELNVGDEFVLFNHYTSVHLRVVRKVRYENFASLVKSEVLSDILPGVQNEREFRAKVREFYQFPLQNKRFLAFGVVLV